MPNPTAGPDPTPQIHTITSPPKLQIGDPLPLVPVTQINGVGYIAASGANKSSPRLMVVVGRVFRNLAEIPASPEGLDYARATIDPMGRYYSFSKALGNMVPGAQGGDSAANVLMTWAKFQVAGANWIQADAHRQFIGT